MSNGKDNNNGGMSFIGVLLVIVLWGGFFINQRAEKDNLSFTAEVQKMLSNEDDVKKAKEEAEKEKRKQFARDALELAKKIPDKDSAANVKKTRLDPQKAKWTLVKEQTNDQMTMMADCDCNGDNIYINENGNVMNLFATRKSGIDYDRYGNKMHLNPDEYLVFVLEIDINNGKQRMVETYKYNKSTGVKSDVGFDTSKYGKWENLNTSAFPNYYDWIRDNYNNFYKIKSS